MKSSFAIAAAGYLASFCRGKAGQDARERMRAMQADMDEIAMAGKRKTCAECGTQVECQAVGVCLGSAI